MNQLFLHAIAKGVSSLCKKNRGMLTIKQFLCFIALNMSLFLMFHVKHQMIIPIITLNLMFSIENVLQKAYVSRET